MGAKIARYVRNFLWFMGQNIPKSIASLFRTNYTPNTSIDTSF